MRLPLALMFLLAVSASGPASADATADARALLEARDPKAASAIAALVKAEPRSAAARVLLVRLLLQQGKAKEAVDIAKAAVKMAPNEAQAQYWLGNAYGMRIGQVGMLSKLGMAPDLRDAFERAIELDPDLVEARANLVQFYLQAPAAIGGGVDKAKAQLPEIARRDPARGHAARAQVLMHEKQPAEALKAYEAALAAKPGDAGYRLMVGLGYQEAKLWDRAHAHFTAWTREDPKATSAWYQVGRTAALSGKWLEDGAAALRTYLTLPLKPNDPEKHHALYRLGQVLAAAGDTAGARASFQQALKGDPGNSDFKKALAAL